MTQRFKANSRYLPADELLASARVRVLRAMRRFDWVTVNDICVALDDRASYHEFWSAIRRHLAEGHVERDPSSTPRAPRYRITPLGRQHYDALLARTLVDEERIHTRSA